MFYTKILNLTYIDIHLNMPDSHTIPGIYYIPTMLLAHRCVFPCHDIANGFTQNTNLLQYYWKVSTSKH